MIEYKGDLAVLSGVVGIEEAEKLYNWLLEGGEKRIAMEECEHLHTACLQLLLIFRPKLVGSPKDGNIGLWLSFLEEASEGGD